MVRNVAFLIALALISTAASAQSQVGSHTAKEEDACDRDAHRFCREAIPDQFRVLSCLQTNRDKLSHTCKAVLQSHGI
jgi:hypothetical protein